MAILTIEQFSQSDLVVVVKTLQDETRFQVGRVIHWKNEKVWECVELSISTDAYHYIELSQELGKSYKQIAMDLMKLANLKEWNSCRHIDYLDTKRQAIFALSKRTCVLAGDSWEQIDDIEEDTNTRNFSITSEIEG